MTRYLSDEKIEVGDKLISCHTADDFLPGVRSYTTESTHKYDTVGGGRT